MTKSKRCAFTVTAKNRLPSAMVCRDSFVKYNPNVPFVIFLADFIEEDGDVELVRQANAIGFYGLKGLDCFKHNSILEDMAFRYNVTEFCTAVKPFCFEYLFKKYEEVIFFDPDIEFFNDCEPIYEKFISREAIVTPHMFSGYPIDDCKLTDLDVLRAGQFNFGFIGLRRCANTEKFINWWQSKLATQCILSIENGIFVDQSWGAMVVSLCDTEVLRHAGCNVASWNLHERFLTKRSKKYFINEDQLIFYHYSGFDYNRPKAISKYQNRFTLDNRPELSCLYTSYLKKLAKYDAKDRMNIPYFFNKTQSSKPHLEGEIGVDLIGYFPHVGGIMEVARNFSRSIYPTGFKQRICPIKYEALPLIGEAEEQEFSVRYAEPKYSTAFYFINLDEVGNVRNHFPNLFGAKLKIGVPWWELNGRPNGYKNLKYFDEVIVFNEFVEQAIIKSCSGIKINRLRYPMPNLSAFNSDVKHCREKLGFAEDDYIFYFNFDYASGFNRKNVVTLIEAFGKAFPKVWKAKLLLKTIGEDSYAVEASKVRQALKKYNLNKQVTLIDGNMQRSDVLSLLNISDCYISLHASEGLGLGMLEAMSLGKPVICTAYGGNMEVTNKENSLLVDYKMVATPKTDKIYSGEWAKPCVSQAVEYMRQVYKDRNYGVALGKSGQAAITEYSDKTDFVKFIDKVVIH